MYDLLYSVKTNSTRHFRQNRARPRTPWGDLISSPVDNIVSLVSPKKIYGPNSVRKNYFSATPFFTFSQKCNRWP